MTLESSCSIWAMYYPISVLILLGGVFLQIPEMWIVLYSMVVGIWTIWEWKWIFSVLDKPSVCRNHQVSSDEPILMSTIIFVLLILSLSHPPNKLIPHEIGWGSYFLEGRMHGKPLVIGRTISPLTTCMPREVDRIHLLTWAGRTSFHSHIVVCLPHVGESLASCSRTLNFPSWFGMVCDFPSHCGHSHNYM